METWKKDARNEVMIVDIEGLVPQNHLLRKVERVMDYELAVFAFTPDIEYLISGSAVGLVFATDLI